MPRPKSAVARARRAADCHVQPSRRSAGCGAGQLRQATRLPSQQHRPRSASRTRSTVTPSATMPNRRPLRLPIASLPKPPRKKPRTKNKAPSVAPTPSAAPAGSTPTPTAPTPSPSASNFMVEENVGDALNVLDGMPPSEQSFMDIYTRSAGIDDIPLTQSPANFDEDVREEIHHLTKKRGQRAGNYTVDEDVALVMAWERVSLDPITGNDQNSSTYWKRISDHFHRTVNPPSNRSIGSLQHRWATIQECCNRWGGCVYTN